ncbi:MAG: hypothetical protein AAF614_37565 [Chloroflexota bacterium]
MSEYEFTKQENVEIGKMTATLRWFAILFGLYAVSFLIWTIARVVMGEGELIRDIGPAIAGLIAVGVAYLMYQPLDNFKRITTTEGNDISELMTGLKELTRAHKLLRIVLVIFVVFYAIGLVGAFFG